MTYEGKEIFSLNWNRDNPSSLEITSDDGFLSIIYKIENSPNFSESIRKIAKEEREIISFLIQTNPDFRNFRFNDQLDSLCEFIPKAKIEFIEEIEELSKLGIWN